MKTRYILEGLDCASCAGKIENNLNRQDQIMTAELNFVTKYVDVTYSDQHDPDDIFALVEKIVKDKEPHVKVLLEKEAKAGSKHPLLTWTYISTLVSIGLFIGSFFVSFNPLYLLIPAYGLAGFDVVYAAFRNITKGRVFDEQFLMTLATFAAFYVGEVSEAVGVMLFYKVGEILEHLSVERARKNIEASLSGEKQQVAYINPFDEKIIPKEPEEIRVGDVILVKAGERVQLDGSLLSETGFFDGAALTGEADIKELSLGETVPSGYLVKDVPVKIKVTKRYENSTFKRILDMVENAALKKAKSEKMISIFASVYTPIVVVAAVLLTVIPTALGYGTFDQWVYRSALFLVVSCPCALVISIPLVYFVAIGKASRKGIIFKGSTFIDQFRHIDRFLFDKTGTLTQGKFQLKEVLGDPDTLRLAALGESFSTHPLAKAIINHYEGHLATEQVSNLQEISGRGLIYQLDGASIYVGNSRLMAENGIQLEAGMIKGTAVIVARDKKYLGHITFKDDIKPAAYEVMDHLAASSVILSGDKIESVKEVADLLGVDNYKGELLPEHKLSFMESLMVQNGERVAFIGDGINDGPVLARADLAIAMGESGSDLATEYADVIILNDDIGKINDLRSLSKQVKRKVIENIVLALGIKFGVLVLGAFGLASMWMAVFADVGVAVLAILNAARIKMK